MSNDDQGREHFECSTAEHETTMTCAFGPEGEHCDVVACCDECLKPTCDFCGYGHNEEEDDWLCPDHAPEGKAGT